MGTEKEKSNRQNHVDVLTHHNRLSKMNSTAVLPPLVDQTSCAWIELLTGFLFFFFHSWFLCQTCVPITCWLSYCSVSVLWCWLTSEEGDGRELGKRSPLLWSKAGAWPSFVKANARRFVRGNVSSLPFFTLFLLLLSCNMFESCLKCVCLVFFSLSVLGAAFADQLRQSRVGQRVNEWSGFMPINKESFDPSVNLIIWN